MTTFSINEVVTRIGDRFAHLFKQYQIETSLTLEKHLPLIDARPIDLEAVLINLVTNSVYFLVNSETTRREIRVETGSDNQMVTLVFADSGPGISAELRRDVFLPFVTTKAEGTGLGLTIVKDTIESYGGRVEVIDSRLGGAGFRLSLPFRDES